MRQRLQDGIDNLLFMETRENAWSPRFAVEAKLKEFPRPRKNHFNLRAIRRLIRTGGLSFI